MATANKLVVFTLDEQQYALPLAAVEKVFPAVEVTPLPTSLENILGVIDVQGRVIPVIDIRKQLGLPGRETRLTDQLILAHTSSRPVALLVDGVSGVIEHTEQEMISAAEILPRPEPIEGVVKLDDGMILIHDIDTSLSLSVEDKVDDAIQRPEGSSEA